MKFFRKFSNKLSKNDKEEKREKGYYYVTEFKDGYAMAIRNLADLHFRDVVIINENYEKISNTKYAHTIPVQIAEYKFFYAYSEEYTDPRKMAMLDKNLNVIFPLKYDKIQYLSEGQFSAEMLSGTTDIYDVKKGMLATNIKGKIVKLSRYAGRNYYKVFMNDITKYGYYNDNFELVVKADYDSLYDIDSEGRIPFFQNNKMGVIYLKTGEKKFRD